MHLFAVLKNINKIFIQTLQMKLYSNIPTYIILYITLVYNIPQYSIKFYTHSMVDNLSVLYLSDKRSGM